MKQILNAKKLVITSAILLLSIQSLALDIDLTDTRTVTTSSSRITGDITRTDSSAKISNLRIRYAVNYNYTDDYIFVDASANSTFRNQHLSPLCKRFGMELENVIYDAYSADILRNRIIVIINSNFEAVTKFGREIERKVQTSSDGKLLYIREVTCKTTSEARGTTPQIDLR